MPHTYKLNKSDLARVLDARGASPSHRDSVLRGVGALHTDDGVFRLVQPGETPDAPPAAFTNPAGAPIGDLGDAIMQLDFQEGTHFADRVADAMGAPKLEEPEATAEADRIVEISPGHFLVR